MDKKRSIFISYRREDSAYAAGRLYDRLSQHFGGDRIFMDIDAIRLGIDFVQQIETAVGACDVLLAVIGPRWLEALDEKGQRRLDNPNDFVLLEISTALKRDVYVVPVLVDSASVPRLAELPVPLHGLERRNGIEISHTRFGVDAEKLIRGIEEIFEFMEEEPESTIPETLVVDDIVGEAADNLVKEPVQREPDVLDAQEDQIETSDVSSDAIQPDHRLRQFIIYTMLGFALGDLQASLTRNALSYDTDNISLIWGVTGLLASAISYLFVGIALRKTDQRVDRNQIFTVIGLGVLGGIIASSISSVVTNAMIDAGSTGWELQAVNGIFTSLLGGGLAGLGIGFALKQVVENFEWRQVWKVVGAWVMGHICGFLIGILLTLAYLSIDNAFTPSSSTFIVVYAIEDVIFSLLSGAIVGYIGGRAILTEIGQSNSIT